MSMVIIRIKQEELLEGRSNKMAKKENRYKDYDITTQAIHTGTDYDEGTGAVRRPLHMANSYKLPGGNLK